MQRPPAHPELARCLRAIALAVLQRANDQLLLCFLHRHLPIRDGQRARSRRCLPQPAARFGRQIFQTHLLFATKNDRALLTAQVRRWFEASGKFRAVVDSASKADASWNLEGNVTALYGDYRDPATPKAVLEMQFLLLTDQRSAPQIVFQKAYQQAVPLEGRGPEELTGGWSRALGAILTALEADLPAGKP
jgi:hypothetical protein